MLKSLFIITNILISIIFSAALSHAKILIVSPHPDDDIIMSSGVIERALLRGEPVEVVFMTNGDLNGGTTTGYLREGEAVSAQNILGVPENNLIFLGYPDGNLNTIYTSYTGINSKLTTSNGISATYGNRGLGQKDYHTYRFGSPANYNMANILMDLEDIISSYQPDNIFVTSEFDSNLDHATTYKLLSSALASVHSANPSYIPIVHKTIIWWTGNTWPNSADPAAYTAQIPNLTSLSWNNRESIDVPLPMQATNYSSNPKALAIAAHASQGGLSGYIGNFLHKDEFFWSENQFDSYQPPIENAGLDQWVNEGATVTLDGSQSLDPNGSQLTYQWAQRTGPTVLLANSSSAKPSFTAPSGLSQDATLSFELVVSDGRFTSVPDAVSAIVQVPQINTSNISSLATVTASSDTPLYGQTAAKAVDGFTDGYPTGNPAHEWATNGQGVGAWLTLAWPVPYTVNQIVLYDRPNLSDNITSATITFSDGSSMVVGPLNNDGTATTYPVFPAKVITSLTMTVTGVSASTQNVGLAEIQVYGAAVQTQYTLSTSVSPSGAGTVTTSSSSPYYAGTQVTLTAVPNTGYAFSGWSGDAAGTVNPITITMNGNKSVTALFTAIPGTLTVTPSTGLTSTGAPGGPFTPSTATYTLQNAGNTSVSWGASATQPWITLSQSSGTLAPGGSTPVIVSINSNGASLAAGTYSDTVTFANSTNGNGNTTRGVSLTVAVQSTNIASLATVTASSDTPLYGQTAAKAIDGFTDGYPTGNAAHEWATNGQGVGAWLKLAWPVPYTVNQIVLYDRPNLSDNITSATITFSDGSSMVVGPLNNDGTATTYSVSPAKVVTGLTMTVTGVSASTQNVGLAEIQVYGVADSVSYTLSTSASPTGAGTITASPSSPYYAGTQVTLTAVPNTGYAFSGWSGDAAGTVNPVTITMNGNKSVTALFTAIPGTLTVTPSTGLTSTGAPGGPFTPSTATYTLQNAGNTSVSWGASATQPWITLSQSSGTLAPGGSTPVIVSINSNGASLAAGTYSDTVTFTNTTNGNGNTTRGVSLTVAVQSTNIASLATVTASSDTPLYGQTAAKAIDGFTDGYPTGNAAHEWATNGQGVGAWLKLAWSVPYTVNQIVLYDRPNLSDNITSATITFSDGSSMVVGPLNNDGTATTYPVSPAKVVTGLTMTVTGVSASTQNVGLAEIQVYGVAVQTQYTLSTSVSPSGAGTVTTSPSSPYYAGTQVTLTAVPNTGYAFSGWSGDAAGTVNPVTITMNGNKTVTALFTAIPGTLTVTPSTGLTSTGAPGGPFTPSTATYTLQNAGNTSVSWGASATQPWITLSQSTGTLAPGGSTPVIVSINSNGASLVAGTYSDTVTFTNTTNGNGNTTRGVSLTVAVQTTNIAPLAAVTASSEDPLYGQNAIKAVDGCIDGYPGNATCEWVTNGQGVGAWLNLTWPVPYVVNQIVLYDRPDLSDQITGATISFSDGTSIVVGPLNNGDSATTYTFPNKLITNLTMTVNSVSSTTTNVGLAEIQVFGAPLTSLGKYNLTADTLPLGSGTVSVSPSSANYNSAQQVTITAIAEAGYTFTGWSGDATGAVNPLTITMNGNKTVTANFTPVPYTLSITSAGGYTPTISVSGSPSISWLFAGGTPASSTSPTPGAISFPDSTVRTSTLNVSPPTEITSFEIMVPEQLNQQQANEIQTIAGLEQLPGLTNLYLFDTGLTSLPNVNALMSLQTLYCSHNFLGGTNLRLNGLKKLTLVHSFGNNFSAQEVDQLFIDLDNNGLSNGEFNLSYNAGPSAASATARNNLLSRGNTLEYNTLLSNPGYLPAVSTVGANIQVAGGTRFTITAPGATDIKVDIQDLGVQHISSGVEVFYYLGNPNQIRNLTIEVTPPSALTAITFQGSGREAYYSKNPNYASMPFGNIYSISGLDRFLNLQQLAFSPANVLNDIFVPNGVGANLTSLALSPATGVVSPLVGTDADALIAALVAAGAPNGSLNLPNRTSASDANAAILRARGWSGVF